VYGSSFFTGPRHADAILPERTRYHSLSWHVRLIGTGTLYFGAHAEDFGCSRRVAYLPERDVAAQATVAEVLGPPYKWYVPNEEGN
jgi:hypothetical protein